jgi:hypothetical protein
LIVGNKLFDDKLFLEVNMNAGQIVFVSIILGGYLLLAALCWKLYDPMIMSEEKRLTWSKGKYWQNKVAHAIFMPFVILFLLA